MKELKQIDYRLLFELMKDSHRSDRQLAKALGVSQPTVTRRRSMLEKNYIEGYTIIPKFGQIGFELIAFTFLKSKHKQGTDEKEALDKMREWYMTQPNVILVQSGQGMGWDTVCVSLHRSYTEFAEFTRAQNAALAEWIVDSQAFIADLKPGLAVKPFHLKYLANHK
ncbi:MAG: AsnC family transcriptional regulator [Candidatus Bathyarchaeota archaeon]|nr:AsnC family transcriptional regulator [Candidatus Bathyarchaeota archaeon]